MCVYIYIQLCISLCIYLYIFIMLKLSIFDLFLLYTHCIISLALFALFTFDLSSFSLCFCLYLSLSLSHLFSLYLQQTNYPASDLIMNWSQFVLNSFQYQPQFLNGAQRPSPIRKAAKPISSLDPPPPLPLSPSLPLATRLQRPTYVVS